MNKGTKMTFEIAKWEFSRWFKLKEQITTIIIGALLSVLIFGGIAIIEKYSNNEINISVFNNTQVKVLVSNNSKLKLTGKQTLDFTDEKKRLIEKKIDGILQINDENDIKILVNKDHAWISELQESLAQAVQQFRIEKSNIPPEQLLVLLKEISPKIIYTAAKNEGTSAGEKIAAGVFIGLMFLGIIFGLSYQFLAITGEKQLRITEVIISSVTPQTWIDGKILGISVLSLALVLTYIISSFVFVKIAALFGMDWAIPISLTNPFLIIALFLFSLAGFFFWNTFFSALAATINDPNTSARSSLILVPAIPVALSFLALGNPDSTIMKILSLFPFTSSPVISIRLVLTDVSIVEIVPAFLLLLLSIWYMRLLAGKIFSASILMYGKEPTWKEMLAWMRKA